MGQNTCGHDLNASIREHRIIQLEAFEEYF